MRRVLIFMLIILLYLPVVFVKAKNQENIIPTEAVFEKLFEIEVGYGENKVAYSPDMPGYPGDGPASFTLDEKKCFYILDTLNKKILVYEGNQWKRNIDISYIDYGIDILYNNNRLYILEGNNIFEIDEYGKIHNIYSLPAGVESYQVKGLSVNGKNKVVIQSEKFEYEIDTHKKTAGYSFNGIDKKLTTEFIDSKNEEIIDFEHNKKYSITFAEKSGCIHLVGVDKKGNIYITVEEDIPSSLVLVEHTIRMITPDGRQFYARVPLEEYYNFPKRFINVTKDGEVYITVQKEKKVEFYKVTLGKKYDSKIEQLKEKAKEFKEKYKDTVSILGPIGDVIPRSEVEKRADAMINLEWEYRYENSVISNPNVKKPKHLAKIRSSPIFCVKFPLARIKQ